MTPLPLLKLDVRCRCGRVPPIRTTEAERDRKRQIPPDELVETHQCRCGEVFPITAEAYQNAA